MLIADDDPIVREIARHGLGAGGFEVLEAATGDEAVRLAEQRRPHIVVLDWLMPGLQGPDACEAIRNSTTTWATPVVLLTSRTTEEEVRTAFEKGADDYLTKPFDPRELVAIVQRLIDAPPRRAARAPASPALPRESAEERDARHRALFEHLQEELEVLRRSLDSRDTDE